MTGDLLGEVFDQRLHGPPMSYQVGDKQYIAAGGGRDDDNELLVFALPD